MNFGQAIESLKEGKKLARLGWDGKGTWVVLMPSLSLPVFNAHVAGAKIDIHIANHIGLETPLESQPYFAMWTAQKTWQPGWLASQADMLAEDWGIV